MPANLQVSADLRAYKITQLRKSGQTYVLHTEGKEGQGLPDYVQRIRADMDWGFVELPAGHAAHVTAPRQLASLLMGLA